MREAEAQQQQMEELLSRGESLMVLPQVSGSPVVQSIRSDIRTLESKRIDLSSKLGENHPQYQLVETEIKEARERLNKEITSIADSIRSAVRLAKEKEQSEQQALQAQKELVLTLKQEHDDIAVLQRDVESAQQTYNAALNQFNTSSLQSVVDQTNVSVVDSALPPGRPSGPRAGRNLVLGVLAGLVLGIGLVVLLELLDRRVRSRYDIIRDLELPLLGMLNKA